MVYSLKFEGIGYTTIKKNKLSFPRSLERIGNFEIFYTHGRSDPFSVCICHNDICRVLFFAGLYKWTKDIFDIIDIKHMRKMIDEIQTNVLDEKRSDKCIINAEEKINKFINNSKKISMTFMPDWFSERSIYIIAYIKVLGHFYFSAKRKKGAWIDAITCAILDFILNYDVDIAQYEDEMDYFKDLAMLYEPQFLSEKGRRENPSEFGNRIFGRLKVLNRQSLNSRIDNAQKSILYFREEKTRSS